LVTRGVVRPFTRKPRVLIIVQNLPVPFDRRVWLESQSLVRAGYDVTVICPEGNGTGPFQVLDDVTIYGYRPYAPGGSPISFVFEYAYSMFATARLARRARRRGVFDVIQACNPPDVFWPMARWFKVRDRTRFVFDHHDLCPELYESRFPEGSRLAHRGLLLLERQTFRAADHVTSTNASYARIAFERGHKKPDEVTVVRTGPDAQRLKRIAPDHALRRGRTHLATYLGVMGPQDGVEIVIRAADVIVNQLGRQDIGFTLMGSGDCYDELVALRDDLGLRDHVELPGRVSDETVAAVLSTADVGLCPDPMNALNNVSTMNKTMEYMAYELPVLAFDLLETRVSAQEAARYVEPNDVTAFARALVELMDDPVARKEMGQEGRLRVETELAWPYQEAGYVRVFDTLTGYRTGSPNRRMPAARPPSEV
jgi:glycosyltransferase involved in cell wall biosynthesis